MTEHAEDSWREFSQLNMIPVNFSATMSVGPCDAKDKNFMRESGSTRLTKISFETDPFSHKHKATIATTVSICLGKPCLNVRDCKTVQASIMYIHKRGRAIEAFQSLSSTL